MPNMHVDTMPAHSQRWMYRRPDVAGWYWWQCDPISDPFIVELYRGSESDVWLWSVGRGDKREPQLMVDDPPYSSPGGRWLGPITPPMAHEAWRPEDERMSADAALSNFEKVGNYLAGAVYTDFDAYQHNEADLAVIEPVCQYPGCCDPAVCRAPNFADRLVCAEHLAIVNGTAAYRAGIDKTVRQQG